MKLWLIMLWLNTVVVSVGPLPYGMDECEEQAREYSNEILSVYETGRRFEYNGQQLSMHDIRIFCFESEDRPELNSKWER